MKTSFSVRIILIIASGVAIACQVSSLFGHGWFGFDVTVRVKNVTVRQHVEYGLFDRSPYLICIDKGDGYGDVCNTLNELSPVQKDRFRRVLTTVSAADNSFHSVEVLVIIGLVTSCVSVALLYTYLFCLRKSTREKHIGIVCASAWAFAALMDIIGVGKLVLRYKTENSGMKLVEDTPKLKGIEVTGELMLPWAPIVIGIGAALALIVGILVALTTNDKRFDKTSIVYREMQDSEGLLNEDEMTRAA